MMVSSSLMALWSMVDPWWEVCLVQAIEGNEGGGKSCNFIMVVWAWRQARLGIAAVIVQER